MDRRKMDRLKMQKDLKKASEPLKQWIRATQTPMTTVIVTGAGVEVLSTEMHVPFDKNWN